MNYLKNTFLVALACGMCSLSGSAYALGDQWYFGLGGSSTWLQPNAEEPGVGIKRRLSAGGHAFFGMDIDDRSSGQITVYSLGDSELKNQEIVPYQAVDGSILYRIYDTKDASLKRGGVSLALYGRFALGYMHRDTDVPLSNAAEVYFGAGGGAELFFTRNLSMRLEGMYHDQDAASGSLQLVARFGGARGIPSQPPSRPSSLPPATADSSAADIPTANVPTTPAVPVIPDPSVPTTPVIPVPSVPKMPATPVSPTLNAPAAPVPSVRNSTLIADADGDKVPDSQDQCPRSRRGFPVRATGCALFDGVLSGVSFVEGTAQLKPDASNQLDFLANVLAKYPNAKVELHSHTDDQGTVREQAILTRARLRTIGTYLVRKGVRSNRLVLRSFGGTRPLYDNTAEQGRAANNRIEVIEKSN